MALIYNHFLSHFFLLQLNHTYMKRTLHLISVKNITFKSFYNWLKIDIFQNMLMARETPHPFMANAISNFPNFPNHYSIIIHYTQFWILSRLHSYIPASAFIIFILFIAQWNSDLNLWSQHYHCLLLLFLITVTVISCSGAARGFDQCPSWVSIQKASFDPIRSFTLSN